MITDLNDIETGTNMRFDLVVVGAGPAGLAIVNELCGQGLKVCLLESGGYSEEADTQSLYKGHSIGQEFVVDEGRYRVFGGSATRWGGRCATLDPIDFETRDWVPYSGWPISFSDLEPYYERAKFFSNFKQEWKQLPSVAESLGICVPALENEKVYPFVWRVASPDRQPSFAHRLQPGWCRTFDYGKAYGPSLIKDPDTYIILHANLMEFHSSAEGDVVKSVTISTLSQKRMTINADRFVLCCGGIENARLLLSAPAAVLRRANTHDNIGRFLGQHPRGTIGTVVADEQNAIRLQQIFNNFHRSRGSRAREPQYEIGFALTEAAQREHKILNASAALTYYPGEGSPWRAAKNIETALRARSLGNLSARDLANVAKSPEAIIPNMYRRFVSGRHLLHANPTIEIEADFEQEPAPSSRITLGTDQDAFGMRRVTVDWRLGESERRTARHLCEFLKAAIEKCGLGHVVEAEWLCGSGPIELKQTYHAIGTTRMSSTPAEGVVDPNCRVHGLRNLYIAGCSVFPTGGHANPTLTIIALAIRLSEHLKSEIQKENTPCIIADHAVAAS